MYTKGRIMNTPHKHAELIKQWADGKEIAWTDDSCGFPVHHSMSLETATAVLQKLYAAWPGGLEEIESAFRTKAAQTVAPGWQLVPVEPTDEMKQTALEAYRAWQNSDDGSPFWNHACVYRAMLSAAPSMPPKETV